MITFFSKEKIFRINKLLIGHDNEFKAEHQILNGSIIIIAIIYLITFILNFVPELKATSVLKISNITMVFILLVLYYLSRIKTKYNISIIIFYLSLFTSFTISWFMAGGIISSIPFYYAAFLCYIIFFSDGWRRKILILLYTINILVLSTIESHHPEFVKYYPNRELKIQFMIKGFISMVILVIYIVYSAKNLYLKEKQNTIDIINQYRLNSTKLKQEFQDKYDQLSIRERDVFNLIIEGKSNQDIAEKLFIEVGTVKLHINKIYKKLGTKDRKETINYITKHN